MQFTVCKMVISFRWAENATNEKLQLFTVDKMCLMSQRKDQQHGRLDLFLCIYTFFFLYTLLIQHDFKSLIYAKSPEIITTKK